MKHICISTGSFHLHFEGRDYHSRLKKCMELKGIDGVELLFDVAEHLLHFEITKEEIEFLKGLKFNTIHVPFYLDDSGKRACYRNTPFYIKLMEKVYEIYDKIGACNINIHPEETEDYSLFRREGYNYSIENSPAKSGYSPELYRKILDENPNFRMVLDISRAMESNQLNELIAKFRKEIIYCHASAYNGQKQHIFMHGLEPAALEKIRQIRELDCPFISETWVHHPIEFYQKEIDFLKKWLGNP
ncbi:hypothetical protein JW707_00615 [Candidatus Woesearchaeota archaeon]|nr:hypothetical protein [Candidatus Woesearchaeota archaeon]